MKNAVIYLFLALFAISGCKKYDEGPAISLRSKEARLCREWKVDKIQLNGDDVTGNDDYGITEYKKDGSVTVSYDDPEFGPIVYNAQWRFADNKDFLEVSEPEYNGKASFAKLPPFIKHTLESEWTSYEILRLTSKELFLKYEIVGTNEYRIEYKAN